MKCYILYSRFALILSIRRIKRVHRQFEAILHRSEAIQHHSEAISDRRKLLRSAGTNLRKDGMNHLCIENLHMRAENHFRNGEENQWSGEELLRRGGGNCLAKEIKFGNGSRRTISRLGLFLLYCVFKIGIPNFQPISIGS
jgi:hypothetical protein